MYHITPRAVSGPRWRQQRVTTAVNSCLKRTAANTGSTRPVFDARRHSMKTPGKSPAKMGTPGKSPASQKTPMGARSEQKKTPAKYTPSSKGSGGGGDSFGGDDGGMPNVHSSNEASDGNVTSRESARKHARKRVEPDSDEAAKGVAAREGKPAKELKSSKNEDEDEEEAEEEDDDEEDEEDEEEEDEDEDEEEEEEEEAEEQEADAEEEIQRRTSACSQHPSCQDVNRLRDFHLLYLPRHHHHPPRQVRVPRDEPFAVLRHARCFHGVHSLSASHRGEE